MPQGSIKVFQHGKGTTTLLQFQAGRHTITRQGAGRFLDQTFETVKSASDFCTAELRKHPEAVLYVLEGDVILQTILDHDFHKARERQRTRQYEVFSTLILAAVSWLAVTATSPFGNKATLLLAAGVVLFHVFALFVVKRHAVTFTVLALLLLCGNLSSLGRIRERQKRLFTPQVSPSPLPSTNK